MHRILETGYLHGFFPPDGYSKGSGMRGKLDFEAVWKAQEHGEFSL